LGCHKRLLSDLVCYQFLADQRGTINRRGCERVSDPPNGAAAPAAKAYEPAARDWWFGPCRDEVQPLG